MILGTFGQNQWLPVKKATTPKARLAGSSVLGDDVRMSQTVATSYPKEPSDTTALLKYTKSYAYAAAGQFPSNTAPPSEGEAPPMDIPDQYYPPPAPPRPTYVDQPFDTRPKRPTGFYVALGVMGLALLGGATWILVRR